MLANRQPRLDRCDGDDRVQAGVEMVQPVAIRLLLEMLDLRLVLRDEHVIRERRVPLLIAREFVAAVERFLLSRIQPQNGSAISPQIEAAVDLGRAACRALCRAQRDQQRQHQHEK